MRLSPIRPDLELSGRRAPHPEMTPRKLDGFHKEFAEGVGFFSGVVLNCASSWTWSTCA